MQIFFVHLRQASYMAEEDIEISKSKEQFYSEK